MPKFLSSASVVLGAVIAALQGLNQGGFVADDHTAAVTALLSSLIVILRFRKGAGSSITDAQASNPN